eukprot:Selendium_serpulae@DN6428_c0_g2_i4.p2
MSSPKNSKIPLTFHEGVSGGEPPDVGIHSWRGVICGSDTALESSDVLLSQCLSPESRQQGRARSTSVGTSVIWDSPYTTFSDCSATVELPPYSAFPTWTPERIALEGKHGSQNGGAGRSAEVDQAHLTRPDRDGFTSEVSTYLRHGYQASLVAQHPQATSISANLFAACEKINAERLSNALNVDRGIPMDLVARAAAVSASADDAQSFNTIPNTEAFTQLNFHRTSEQLEEMMQFTSTVDSSMCRACQVRATSVNQTLCFQCYFSLSIPSDKPRALEKWRAEGTAKDGGPGPTPQSQTLQGDGERKSPNGGEKDDSGPDHSAITIFVHNFDRSKEDKHMLRLFADHATILKVDVIKNPRTGRHKGYAFVKVSNEADAARLIETFNGFEWEGRKIGVERKKNPRLIPVSAEQRQQPPPPPPQQLFAQTLAALGSQRAFWSPCVGNGQAGGQRMQTGDQCDPFQVPFYGPHTSMAGFDLTHGLRVPDSQLSGELFALGG